MTSFSFLAWSLLVAGLLAALLAVTARRSTDDLLQKIVTTIALLFFGAILTSDFAKWFMSRPAPAWTWVLHDSWMLVMGLFFVANFREPGRRLTTGQLLGVIMIGAGTAFLGLDFFQGGRPA